MRRILYMLPEGKVRIGEFSKTLLAIMTGEGNGWDADQRLNIINRYVNLGQNFDIAATYVMGMAVGGLSEESAMKAIMENDKKTDVLNCWLINEETLPPERDIEPSFRNAWRCDRDGNVYIDLPSARIIHIDQIRKVRNRELDKLDKLLFKAVETGDTTEEQIILRNKQTLRDIPQNLDLELYTTLKELKVVWPVELPRN